MISDRSDILTQGVTGQMEITAWNTLRLLVFVSVGTVGKNV